VKPQDKIKAQTKTKMRSEFLENQDFYFENGLMVLTAHYLRKRGYCCGNGCRHCPYEKNKKTL
jgi:hypothetical protein